MREIKFRAWDKKKEKLIYQNEMDHLIFPGKRKVENFEDIELMQYTGLKDENGKEIYEGDVVEVDGGYRGRKCIGVVVWEEHGFNLDKIKGDTMTHFDAPWDLLSEGQKEVLGNIHENPELLSS